MIATQTSGRARDRAPVGVAHGRFQPLHMGHLEYLLAARARCECLLVGITNPDPCLTKPDPASPHRAHPEANPFTYYERLLMVRDALVEAGVARSDFEVLPFPVNVPELIDCYAPRDARYFMTIFDDWGRAKRRMLESKGLEVEVLWEGPSGSRTISGTEIRRRMVAGDAWDKLVPSAVARIIMRLGLVARLRDRPSGTAPII